MTIEVGLPLNTLDGGTGTGVAGCNNVPAPAGHTQVTANNSCYTGNWNGKIEAIGNGGYAGTVPSVTSATNAGFVGSSTDNGHSANWCNAINPTTGLTNSQHNCGIEVGGFVLDPNNKLLTTEITDFIDTSEVEQTKWAQTLAQYYYGSNYQIKRTYWNGCSTGGRQGFQMAQFHPDLFDGILAGAPAINWNTQIIDSLWPILAVAALDPTDCNGGTADPGPTGGCNAGVTAAFTSAFTYANVSAVTACDTLGAHGLGNDIVADGVINEPRYCTFDATTLIGTSGSPMTSAMTTAQAQAINKIWDGARNQAGTRLLSGPTMGTSNSAYALGAFSSSLIATYAYNWLVQNPNFDIIGNITTSNIGTYDQQSAIKFNDTNPTLPGFVVTAATDNIQLGGLPNTTHAWGITGNITNGQTGTKLLHYRGLSDPLVLPFNSFWYESRLFNLYGVPATQSYFASLQYPGNGHCGSNSAGGLGGGSFPNAGLINATDLFNSLINWVENGTYPASIVAYTGSNDSGNSTLICGYPNQTRWNGSGPTTDASSYSCVPAPNGNGGEDPIISAYDQTAPLYHEAP